MNDLADQGATGVGADKETAIRARSVARDRLVERVEKWSENALERCRQASRVYVAADVHTDQYLCTFEESPSQQA